MLKLSYEDYMKSKEGILAWNALTEVKRDEDQVYYVCPCGGIDHYAVRRLILGGVSAYLSPVLNCFENVKQWMVEPIPILEIVEAEEKMYRQLLEKAEALVPKIVRKKGYSPETIQFLRETHGIPEEVTEEVWEGFNSKK